MSYKILLYMLIAFTIASCGHSGNEKADHDNHEGHEHEEAGDHEEIKFQYTAYSNKFELFAEADAFIVGEKANVLSHFSSVPDFKAVEKGKITITLSVNGNTIQQTLNEPTRKGIYSFDIQPETEGKGTLKFGIVNDEGNFEVIVTEVWVFANDKEAQESSEKMVVLKTNTTVFTKEQSWKIDFATALPKLEPFGQVIRATALVQSSQAGEFVIPASTNGIVIFSSGSLTEGVDINAGRTLFTISGNSFADNSIEIKFSEAKNNFEKAKADYERAIELAKDKIVSEKDLSSTKNQYENSKAIYDNLSKNFTSAGQVVSSPQSGFVKQVLVQNGSYVEAGQPVMVISQNKTLVLKAEIPVKYAPIMPDIKTANIKSIDGTFYSLEQLNGKFLSYGKSGSNDNYLLPVNLQITNNGQFVAGSFVEVYLKTYSTNSALVIPSTGIMEEQGSYFVWVQLTPELFEKREVIIGGTDGINTQIIKGINASGRIITRGAMLVKLSQTSGNLDAHSGHVH